MAKTTTPDKIATNLKSAAKEAYSESKRSSAKKHNPINNLGDWAHPPKKKKKSS